MESAAGGVKYIIAQAFEPNAPKARTSTPTTTIAAITKPLAPPGKVLIFPSRRGLENCQMKIAKRICPPRNETPASSIVSDICSSISPPCVETSAGASHVCNMKGIAEAIAITMIVTASNLPMARASAGKIPLNTDPKSRPQLTTIQYPQLLRHSTAVPKSLAKLPGLVDRKSTRLNSSHLG